MNIIVCVKQVPDAKDVRLDPETNTLAREGVQSIMNPYDQHALEEAVRLKEAHGGEVVVVTMGPPQAEDMLRLAISCGQTKRFWCLTGLLPEQIHGRLPILWSRR